LTRLRYTPPLDWPALLAFLAARAVPGIERIEGDTYVRGSLTVRPGGEGVLELTGPASDDDVRRLRALFDLDADSRAIDAHLARDPLLAPAVAARPGVRVPGSFDPFETAVRAVLGQQVTVRGATTLAERLWKRFGEVAPRSLAAAKPEDIAAIGMPLTRAKCLHGLAVAVAERRLDFASPEASAVLPRLFGFGPWTVTYVAMRCLRDADAFPSGDLGIRKALGGITARQAEERSRAWSPWRAYAAMRLWNSM
jgi:AraC family transcriptional regulator of adaptative response / DNA-3-methyladenine glycosylase II